MKHFLYLLLLSFFLIISPGKHFAQETQVLSIPVEPGQKVEVTGNLNAGKVIPLRWANSSQVACFPATRNQEFEGNHVFYRAELPKYSTLVITLIPTGKHRINLYGIRQSTQADYQEIPPNIHSAVCDSDYPLYAGKTDLSKGGENQDLEFMAINNPYSILIGVAGAVGVKEGDFKLQVEIRGR